MENKMEIPQKPKNRTATQNCHTVQYYHSFSQPSLECKSRYNRDICILIFIATLFTVAKL
jgi:hypothetical protein